MNDVQRLTRHQVVGRYSRLGSASVELFYIDTLLQKVDAQTLILEPPAYKDELVKQRAREAGRPYRNNNLGRPDLLETRLARAPDFPDLYDFEWLQDDNAVSLARLRTLAEKREVGLDRLRFLAEACWTLSKNSPLYTEIWNDLEECQDAIIDGLRRPSAPGEDRAIALKAQRLRFREANEEYAQRLGFEPTARIVAFIQDLIISPKEERENPAPPDPDMFYWMGTEAQLRNLFHRLSQHGFLPVMTDAEIQSTIRHHFNWYGKKEIGRRSSSRKIVWRRTEQQLAYLIHRLIVAGLLPDDDKWAFTVSHFSKKAGGTYNTKQLASVADQKKFRTGGGPATDAKLIEDIVSEVRNTPGAPSNPYMSHDIDRD